MIDLLSFHAAALYGAAFINAALPGPGVALAASRTARSGVASGLRVSIGLLVGLMATMLCALAAMFGVLSLSPRLFEITRWTGIAVLVGLGVVALLPTRRPTGAPDGRRQTLGDFGAGLLVGVTNPNLLVFLLALLPQFVRSGPDDPVGVGLAVVAFLAGGVAGQIGAVVFGAASRRMAGGHARWLDFASSGALLGFAALAVTTPGY